MSSALLTGPTVHILIGGRLFVASEGAFAKATVMTPDHDCGSAPYQSSATGTGLGAFVYGAL